MNVYEAIMKAADHIERNPHMFNFNVIHVPDGPGCGTPGCALGWIACFMGYSEKTEPCGFEKVANVLGFYDGKVGSAGFAFYNAMDALSGSCSWINSPELCVKGLRALAQRHKHGIHPAPPKNARNFARDLYEKVSVAPRIPDNA